MYKLNKLSYSYNSDWGESVAKFDKGIYQNIKLESNGEKAYFQYIKRDISNELTFLEKDKYFDIITPFDYGGFYYTSDEILEKILKEFELKCKQENIISGFFRFNPLLHQNYNLINKYLDIIKLQNHIIVDLQVDYQKYFSRRKTRNIKKARKYQYKFIIEDSVESFYIPYCETMDRLKADQYFYFDIEILKYLVKFGKIFSISYYGIVVSSLFLIEDNDNVYYFLGGTLSSYLQYGFNSLLFDLVFEYYKDIKKIFFLSGGKDGLYKYKSEFSNKTIPFYIGKKNIQ